MKAKMQHITTIILAVLLLFSSAGMPVYEHFCRSSNFYEVSVWPITQCSANSQEQHTCCKTEVKKCCKGHNNPGTDGQKQIQKTCCTYNTDYIALKADMLVSGTAKQKLPLPIPATWLLPACQHAISLSLIGNANDNAVLHKPPALMQTRQSAAVLQIFLC